jgi:hypothetical protein
MDNEEFLKSEESLFLLKKVAVELFNDNCHSTTVKEEDDEEELQVVITYPTDVLIDVLSLFNSVPEIKDVQIKTFHLTRGLRVHMNLKEKYPISAARFQMIKARENTPIEIETNGVAPGEKLWVNEAAKYMLQNFPIQYDNIYAKTVKEHITIIASLDAGEVITLNELQRMGTIVQNIKTITVQTNVNNLLCLIITSSLKKRMRDGMGNNNPSGTQISIIFNQSSIY